MDDILEVFPGKPVVSLIGLVRMKLMANRDHDRTHLRDMIDVDLVSRDMLAQLPPELSTRLDALFDGIWSLNLRAFEELDDASRK